MHCATRYDAFLDSIHVTRMSCFGIVEAVVEFECPSTAEMAMKQAQVSESIHVWSR